MVSRTGRVRAWWRHKRRAGRSPALTSLKVPASPSRKLAQQTVLTALDFLDTSEWLKVICNVSNLTQARTLFLWWFLSRRYCYLSKERLVFNGTRYYVTLYRYCIKAITCAAGITNPSLIYIIIDRHQNFYYLKNLLHSSLWICSVNTPSWILLVRGIRASHHSNAFLVIVIRVSSYWIDLHDISSIRLWNCQILVASVQRLFYTTRGRSL